MGNIQHRRTVTVHSPIYWGTTRPLSIRPTELEPSIYAIVPLNITKNPINTLGGGGDYCYETILSGRVTHC